ncbi:uncharacterized protein LOC116432909 isoform X2 [Nomia melanderi]|nr:uncharacterized protein LOC116432909 isoform X2 [Nomia melanderi]
MDLLKRTQQLKKRKKTHPPMFLMIPIEEKDNIKKKLHITHKTTTPVNDVQAVEKKKKLSRKNSCSNLAIDLKFPEMRGGILFTRCCCVHRDGLQNSCPLTSCQGQSECLVKPWAVCPAAKFFRCRYPQQFPVEKN